MKKKAPQAILTLPMFHGGSEMYERAGSNNSMIPAMIYSYHTGIPIAGVLMSRTSITETKNLIEIFNGYKKQRPLTSLLTQQDFFVLTTHDALFPDESRILGEIKQFGNNDSLGYGYIPLNNLLKRKITEKTDTLWAGNVQNDFIYGNGVYIASQNRKPFLEASIKDYETIYTLDSNAIHSGTYVVSFHYHYSENTYRELACDLIVTRNTEWEHNIPVRRLSGFYPGFAIFEQSLILDKKNKYEFIIKGPLDKPYHVSNFLLRPENETVIIITPAQDTLINNFPLSN
jgi:hypothetical protein